MWGRRDWGEWLLGTSSTQFLPSIPRSWELGDHFPALESPLTWLKQSPQPLLPSDGAAAIAREMISLNASRWCLFRPAEFTEKTLSRPSSQ